MRNPKSTLLTDGDRLQAFLRSWDGVLCLKASEVPHKDTCRMRANEKQRRHHTLSTLPQPSAVVLFKPFQCQDLLPLCSPGRSGKEFAIPRLPLTSQHPWRFAAVFWPGRGKRKDADHDSEIEHSEHKHEASPLLSALQMNVSRHQAEALAGLSLKILTRNAVERDQHLHWHCPNLQASILWKLMRRTHEFQSSSSGPFCNKKLLQAISISFCEKLSCLLACSSTLWLWWSYLISGVWHHRCRLFSVSQLGTGQAGLA